MKLEEAGRPLFYGTLKDVEKHLTDAGFAPSPHGLWEGFLGAEKLYIEVKVFKDKASAGIVDYTPKSGGEETVKPPAPQKIVVKKSRQKPTNKPHPPALKPNTKPKDPAQINTLARQIMKERGYSRQHSRRLAVAILNELSNAERKERNDNLTEMIGMKKIARTIKDLPSFWYFYD